MTITADTAATGITVSQLPVETAALDVVEFDIYRDIHKGIRNELFAVTSEVGAVDPADAPALAVTAERFRGLVRLLLSHAEHEEVFLQGLIEVHAPQLADAVVRDHRWLDAQMVQLEVLADRAAEGAGADQRLVVHKLYLGLASFTADYLGHQAFEELEISPELSIAMGPEELAAVNQAIVASIPPDEVEVALRLMLPAMNVEDRAEMLGGMQAGAPPEVFAGVMDLAGQVLGEQAYAATATRLGVA
jgi:hypothetical protein